MVGWICRRYGRWSTRIKRAAPGLVVILLHVLFRREGISVRPVDDLRTLLMGLAPSAKRKQPCGLVAK